MASDIGNRCGHNPQNPRWFSPPAHHAKRPKILIATSEGIRRYYPSPAEIFPALNACNHSPRQQRSERREACLAAAGALIHYTDLETLQVGLPQSNGGRKGLTVAFLAKLAGLGERRTERALNDLKKSGLITMETLRKRRADGTYRTIASIRTLSRSIFIRLGLGDWLIHEQRKARERREKREEKKYSPQAKILSQVALAALKRTRRRKQAQASGERRNPPTAADLFFALREKLCEDSS